MKIRKATFEPGKWNPESIFLGGLGNEPELNDDEDPVLKLQKTLEQSEPKNKKIHFFKTETTEDRDE